MEIIIFLWSDEGLLGNSTSSSIYGFRCDGGGTRIGVKGGRCGFKWSSGCDDKGTRVVVLGLGSFMLDEGDSCGGVMGEG